MKRPPFSVRFLDQSGAFHVNDPHEISGLYFPLCNRAGLLSAVTPSLHGDIKLDHHTFLTPPVSIEDLRLSQASRNFWIVAGKTPWSVTGESAWQKALPSGAEKVSLQAGFLWQTIERINRKIGLKAVVTNFVPEGDQTCELMTIEVTNLSKRPIPIRAVSAIPLYGRSADNLRDHRHVTSLLHRLSVTKYGLRLVPTMSFNERGHLPNRTAYYVNGLSEDGKPPVGFFPTLAEFAGDGGALDRPRALFGSKKPLKTMTALHQGQEAMGSLVFAPKTLKPGASASYTLILGIDKSGEDGSTAVKRFARRNQVREALDQSKESWRREIGRLRFETGDPAFNNWIQWVQLQPTLRKIFGCSFLPDFDYGRGGRGWRDLWQDCLALLLFNPEPVRNMIRHNFGGVRMDGSNATIIGSGNEFIADRNNISRTWMDHGTWPYLTTRLYIDQTGDDGLLLETAPYFAGNSHGGTLLEHILVQHLVSFFNVGEHNTLRLLDADWNDGLDMAHERGESVAFTHLYAANLEGLAQTLEKGAAKRGWRSLSVAAELETLLDRCGSSALNYDSIKDKKGQLQKYLSSVENGVGGKKISLPIEKVVEDLRAKARWMKDHLNKQEWVEADGRKWFNGYYDNNGRRVEGSSSNGVRMTLTGQVYAIMGQTADEAGVRDITRAVDKYLFDASLGGYRLNTDFGETMPSLGRAFSFAFGEKENGAVFSHMVVMYANALYQRGFVEEGYKALSSLYRMAVNFQRSRIFPGIPEYFNNEARGRYHYLTGSASWYVLTLLTQVFGFRGDAGDLRLAPKLSPDQFDRDQASLTAPFAGCSVTVVYKNKGKVPYARMKLISITDETGRDVPVIQRTEKEVLISRSYFNGLSSRTLTVTLG